MYKVTSRYSAHEGTIKVEWNLGKRCNYNCSYCPAAIHDNTSPYTDIKILKATVDKLLAMGKPIRLSFTGGEPTIHPAFEELINYCKDRGIMWISVTTNGTRKAAWYTNLPIDQFVFSVHMEYNFKRVLQSIIQVKEKFTGAVLVHIMAHQSHMQDTRYLASVLAAHTIPHAVRRVRWTTGDHDSFDDMRYEPTDLAWIKEYEATVAGNCVIDDDPAKIYHANDIIKLHMNQYKGWACNAGIESLMINWDGEVYRATCRVGGSLGNIYNSTIDNNIATIICTRNYCTCSADIPLTKLDVSIREKLF